MNKESLTEKLLDLAEGRETPETWQNWWDEHETELEALLSRGEFLKLKPCRHGFQWVPVFGSQKGAIAILEKSGLAFEASNLYQERYLAELDAFCKEQERVQREKQKEFKGHCVGAVHWRVPLYVHSKQGDGQDRLQDHQPDPQGAV